MPARRLPGPCRSQHHLPSPCHPPASISTLLTCLTAIRASFLPSTVCPLCRPPDAARTPVVAARAAAEAAGAARRLEAACAPAAAPDQAPMGAAVASQASFSASYEVSVRWPVLCPRDPSSAVFCCSCAPPRRLPGPCRSHHRHPSPGHPPAFISTVLTRPSAVRASFLPFPCALCAGIVRRLQRPMRLRGRLEGR